MCSLYAAPRPSMLRLARGVLAIEHVTGDDERVYLPLDDDLAQTLKNFAMLMLPGETPQRLTDMPLRRVQGADHSPGPAIDIVVQVLPADIVQNSCAAAQW